MEGKVIVGRMRYEHVQRVLDKQPRLAKFPKDVEVTGAAGVVVKVSSLSKRVTDFMLAKNYDPLTLNAMSIVKTAVTLLGESISKPAASAAIQEPKPKDTMAEAQAQTQSGSSIIDLLSIQKRRLISRKTALKQELETIDHDIEACDKAMAAISPFQAAVANGFDPIPVSKMSRFDRRVNDIVVRVLDTARVEKEVNVRMLAARLQVRPATLLYVLEVISRMHLPTPVFRYSTGSIYTVCADAAGVSNVEPLVKSFMLSVHHPEFSAYVDNARKHAAETAQKFNDK